MKGMAYPAINDEKFYSGYIALPPLAEQRRIVAKVDELMALCDRLEAQQLEREALHAALARASLARFADVPTPANLNLLFHSSFPISPSDLRKSILTLAVQGKLVPQDPNDEPAEDSAKAARKKAGLAIRALTDLASDETPFEAPESWRWVTVADVADTRLGKMLDKEKNRGEAHPYLRNTNVHWFRFELDSIKTMLFESAELEEYRVEPGDVLICEGGHGIARSAVWDGQIPGIMFQKALHRVRPLSCLNGHFLTFCLWVYERDGILQRYYTGAGIPHFTGKALARVAFPLPPLAEQRRIVAKVSELMALVDELETQLAASRATAEKLLTALVAELTGANS
jgi:type I restriction enzyme S subunit